MAKAPKAAAIVEGDEGDEIEVKEADTRPLYRLAAQAYHDDRLLEKDTKIRTNAVPGWYMQPLDEAARKRVAEFFPNGQSEVDPILQMTAVTAGAPSTEANLLAAMAQMAKSVEQLAQKRP